MGLFYAFQSPFRQVFDKSFCHPIDRRRKPLISVDFLPLKCVDNRGFPALVFSTSFAALLYSKKALILWKPFREFSKWVLTFFLIVLQWKYHLEIFQNNRDKGESTVSLPNIFKALSDPVRREILLKLKQKRKMSAGEIAAEFDLTNATISYHLSTLKKADLI